MPADPRDAPMPVLRAALVAWLLVVLAASPALARPGVHPDGDGCPPPRCTCALHLGAVQIAPPATPTTAAAPEASGRIAAERRPVRAERPSVQAHRPRGPPSADAT